jgi:hypothetical protein
MHLRIASLCVDALKRLFDEVKCDNVALTAATCQCHVPLVCVMRLSFEHLLHICVAPNKLGIFADACCRFSCAHVEHENAHASFQKTHTTATTLTALQRAAMHAVLPLYTQQAGTAAAAAAVAVKAQPVFWGTPEDFCVEAVLTVESRLCSTQVGVWEIFSVIVS